MEKRHEEANREEQSEGEGDFEAVEECAMRKLQSSRGGKLARRHISKEKREKYKLEWMRQLRYRQLAFPTIMGIKVRADAGYKL